MRINEMEIVLVANEKDGQFLVDKEDLRVT